jgi:plasmid stabilization system protein ParE
MAKRVIWSSKADRIFTKILKFYIERNGSKTYSRKLNNEILSIIAILSKQPFLGLKTDKEKVRVFIKGDLKIFYQIEIYILIIHLVWDCRQNPKSLNITEEP